LLLSEIDLNAVKFVFGMDEKKSPDPSGMRGIIDEEGDSG
jgi:hypothetical protein